VPYSFNRIYLAKKKTGNEVWLYDITWKNSKKIGKLKQQVKEYILSDFIYIKLSK
jgi:hypothetical protein